MEISIIIWKFLSREYLDDHQVIYLYVCGNVRTPNTAVEQIMKLARKVFFPLVTEQYLKTIVIAFLDNKKKQYLKGQIKIKSLY